MSATAGYGDPCPCEDCKGHTYMNCEAHECSCCGSYKHEPVKEDEEDATATTTEGEK